MADLPPPEPGLAYWAIVGGLTTAVGVLFKALTDAYKGWIADGKEHSAAMGTAVETLREHREATEKRLGPP